MNTKHVENILTDRVASIKNITDIFNKNVIGKKPDPNILNAKHDGKIGHWLETQMGVVHNRRTEYDIRFIWF